MKRFVAPIIAAFAAVAVLGVIPARAESLKFGYISMQRALENSAAGQTATKKLNELGEKYKTELKSVKDKLDVLRAEVDKNALLWSETKKREKEDELRRQERDFQRQVKDRDDEMKGKQGELSEMIIKDLLKIVEDIGKSEGYTLIVERNSTTIYFAPTSIDLTDRVIKAYDALKR